MDKNGILIRLRYTNKIEFDFFLGDDDHEAVSLSDQRLTDTVDELLKILDTDNDGFISYAEYKLKH